MLKRNAVVLAGGGSLTSAGNMQALEEAGYQVISAHTLDYALVANELFAPKAVVLDAGQMEGDIDFFCRTLEGRPSHPKILLVNGGRQYDARGAPPAGVKRLRGPISPAELVRKLDKL